ncbi:hypothetical protein [Lactococcus lactis]|uniref:hypothetical protein n=2 Tax=Lactococcus lactis TaxID=1358 RepID=UPI0015C30DA1|nr:hypothetical protein [Lactococcus lactis]MCT0445144.1 hypothetical protein [Lactococcus lactis subsp. lactis]MDM7503266.1 hypothetical protein [Lactococcus lactis]QLF91328.1 hypothetical protein HPC60_12445 [Lactococcus lactis subsp. lactis]
MTEYANPIVNAAVKLGMNKKEALLMADNTAEIEFEAIRKLNKSVEYIQSGQFQKDYEAEKWLDKHMD